MKPYLLGMALLAALPSAGQAALFTFDSDATVNVSQGTLPTDVTIGFGELTEVYDGDFNYLGDEWTLDPAPVDTITVTPAAAGYGSSTTNHALYGIWQPILIVFGQPLNVTTFSLFLDESTFGNPFNTPIQFLDENGNVITSLDSYPATPGYEITGANIEGVKTIVLPSGALYDNMTITGSTIPEPSSAAIGALGILGLVLKRRRN